jgi:prepilin-type N-terminal cleavage/methylation domain-containing protein
LSRGKRNPARCNGQPPARLAAGRRRGFSLVELIVVIMIIGMLASMAIPRISRGAEGAEAAALEGDLALIRNALALYAAEHLNQFPGPTADDFRDQLTLFSDAAGNTATARGGGKIYGPYLLRIPPCPTGPNAGADTVLIDATNSPPQANSASGEGWLYNPNTGEFYPNIEGTALPPVAETPEEGAPVKGLGGGALMQSP